MELNISNCSIISFSQKRTIFDFNYKLLKFTIQHVSLINDLGIFFDIKNNFMEFTNKIKNKAYSKLGILKQSCSNFNNHFAIKKTSIFPSYVPR